MKEAKSINKFSKIYWIISTIILGALLVVLFLLNSSSEITKSEAGQKVIDFVESQGMQASLIEVNKKGSIYEVIISVKGEEISTYITKDGDNLITGLVSLENTEEDVPQQTQTSQNLPKQDVPKIELFVMTHCPYGTQAEKGIIPVFETLADKIDAKIRFVHYFMHEGEKQEPYETPVQVCIREEQSDKYYNYLKCFLEDGDSDRCLTRAGIDKNSLNTCINNNADAYYAEDSELSKGYGVRGSPALIINGQIVSSGRDAASYLDTICQAFTDESVPEACGNDMTSFGNPAPGFGFDTQGGSASAAGCGI